MSVEYRCLTCGTEGQTEARSCIAAKHVVHEWDHDGAEWRPVNGGNKRRSHFWRLGRVGGGYSPTSNGAGENAGWTIFLLTTPRWRCEIHRTSKLQAQREAEMRAHPYVECDECGDATSHDALGRCPCRT